MWNRISYSDIIQGRSKRVDSVDNVQGPQGSREPPTKMIPLVRGGLNIPCPCATEVLAMHVILYKCYLLTLP